MGLDASHAEVASSGVRISSGASVRRRRVPRKGPFFVSLPLPGRKHGSRLAISHGLPLINPALRLPSIGPHFCKEAVPGLSGGPGLGHTTDEQRELVVSQYLAGAARDEIPFLPTMVRLT